jgi:tetratricopeptide (TPR) repeat protein
VLTLILGLAAAAIVAVVANIWLWIGWSIALAVVAFMATTILINLAVKKRLEAVFTAVQNKVETTQDQLRRKINLMQTKNISGGKGLQRRMEKDQADGIRDAMKELDRIDPLRKWNLLAERQANTLRAQLCYQIKEFDRADEYFKKCLVLDALTLAMKIARMYSNGEKDKIEKAFKRGVKRFKDEKGVILYALYSWILVKEERMDEAVAILDEAKDKTESEVLKANWEHLANGRVRRFSNAGLGDQWYALHLDQPKPVKVKQRFAGGRRR